MQIKPSRKGDDDDTEAWLMTYADTITLLMAFFVILFSLAEPDKEKFKHLAAQFRMEGFSQVVRPSEAKELKKKLQLMLEDSGFDQYAGVTETDKAIEIELASSAFYESGTARFSAKAIPVLEQLAQNLKKFEKSAMVIEIEGHTDDSPISTARFPSNWELSGARASNVARYLIAKGIAPGMLRSVALADTKPKAQNRDAAGNPIPANQELNRRVVVKVIKR